MSSVPVSTKLGFAPAHVIRRGNMKERLEKLGLSVQERAKELIEELEQELDPILFIETERGTVLVDFGGVTDKLRENVQLIFASLLKRFKAIGYVFVCEAWMTSSSRPLKENIRISDLPLDDRVETVHLILVEKANKTELWSAKIRNTPAGRKVEEFERYTDFEGRFVIPNW